MRWSAQTYFAGVAGVAETDLLVDFLLVFLALVALVVVAVLLEADFVAGAGAGAVVCAIRETPANARVIVAPRIAEIVFFILVGCPLSKRFCFFSLLIQ
jgi:hypothetical protein